MPYAAGWQRTHWLGRETEWGQPPVTDLLLPVRRYDVRVQRRLYRPDVFCGRRHGGDAAEVASRSLAGRIEMDLSGRFVTAGGESRSQARHVLDAMLGDGADLLPASYTIAVGDLNDGKQHTGLRTDALTLAGVAGGPVTLTVDAVGRREIGGVAAPPVDPGDADHRPHPPLRTIDATLKLDGAELSVQSFALTVENGLKPHWLGGLWPDVLVAGRRSARWQVRLLKDDDAFDVLRRADAVADATGELVLRGHNGGSGPDPAEVWTVATVALGRVRFAAAEEQVSLDDLDAQAVEHLVLKPDSAAADVAVTWTTQ